MTTDCKDIQEFVRLAQAVDAASGEATKHIARWPRTKGRRGLSKRPPLEEGWYKAAMMELGRVYAKEEGVRAMSWSDAIHWAAMLLVVASAKPVEDLSVRCPTCGAFDCDCCDKRRRQ